MNTSRNKILLLWLILTTCLVLASGCALNIQGERYQNVQPGFDLKDFFNGQVKVWGIVQDRSGNLVQRFTADIEGRVEGGRLTLDETFQYSLGDGVKQRTWVIDETTEGQYQGKASDISDLAQGRSFGNALYWNYEMDLPVGNSSYRVRFDDWIWAFDKETIINRSYIKKFGLVFAEVTIFMRKVKK